jgi:hypothetical protein
MTPGDGGDVTLAAAAAELYGLAPEAFTGARNARARDVAAAGDRALAAEIRGLAKPTAAAWLANVLVRVSPSIVDELIGLGPELRRAQSQGQRTEMRRIVDRRRVLIGELVGTATAAAREAGAARGSAVRRQLEETLEAAVADEGSGAALRQGQLVEPLRFVGFGPSAAPDGGTTVTPASRKATPKKATGRGGERRRRGGDADPGPNATATAEATSKAEAKAKAKAKAAEAEARRAERDLEASVGEAEARHRRAADRYRRAVDELEAAGVEKAAAGAALTERRRALTRARRRSR